jgi:hypothetical protein
MNRKYFWIIFAIVLLSTILMVSAKEKTDKKSVSKDDYRIEDNEIDDSPHSESKSSMGAKPIAVIAKTIKSWIYAIPEAIVSLVVNLLSPYISPKLIREKTEYILESLGKIIVQELPKAYRSLFGQLTQFLDMFEMIG